MRRSARRDGMAAVSTTSLRKFRPKYPGLTLSYGFQWLSDLTGVGQSAITEVPQTGFEPALGEGFAVQALPRHCHLTKAATLHGLGQMGPPKGGFVFKSPFLPRPSPSG